MTTQFTLLNDLNESKLIPSYWNISKYTAPEAGDMVYIYFLSLYVLISELTNKQWAMEYARKTNSHGLFNDKSSSATDLYVLLYSLKAAAGFKDKSKSYEYLDRMRVDWGAVSTFLHDMSVGTPGNHRSVLLMLDAGLRIQDSSLKALRRTVMNWEVAEQVDRFEVVTRLLVKLKNKAQASELIPFMETLRNAL